MKISKSSYYYWTNRNNLTSPLKERTLFLDERIKKIFKDSREIYGSYRIQKMLEREGLSYNRSYIARRMKRLGLKSVLRRKYIVTTDSSHTLSIAKNILDRDFLSL